MTFTRAPMIWSRRSSVLEGRAMTFLSWLTNQITSDTCPVKHPHPGGASVDRTGEQRPLPFALLPVTRSDRSLSGDNEASEGVGRAIDAVVVRGVRRHEQRPIGNRRTWRVRGLAPRRRKR